VQDDSLGSEKYSFGRAFGYETPLRCLEDGRSHFDHERHVRPGSNEWTEIPIGLRIDKAFEKNLATVPDVPSWTIRSLVKWTIRPVRVRLFREDRRFRGSMLLQLDRTTTMTSRALGIAISLLLAATPVFADSLSSLFGVYVYPKNKQTASQQ